MSGSRFAGTFVRFVAHRIAHHGLRRIVVGASAIGGAVAATLAFKLRGDLTELLSPELQQYGLALTIEVGVEKKLVPTDVATLTKLRELMDNA